MTSALRKLLAAFLVLGASAAAIAQPTPPGAGDIRVEPEFQPPDRSPHPPAVARAASSRVAAVLLDRPSAAELAQLRAPSKQGAPLQVGFGRAVAALQDEASLHSKLSWTTLGGGRQVAAVSIQSPGAAALRAGLRIVALPADAVVRFYAPGGEVFEVPAEDILEAIARNLDAGEHTPDARTYWSPAVEADTLVVEFDIPATTRTTDVHVFIPQVSHLVTNAARDFAMEKAGSASCELDVMCYSAWSGAESNAVARMLFTDAGSSYLCSGTLLADRDTSTTIPYFLSANHCISNQSAASTLQTYWFFRSTACNSGVLGNYQTLTGGATLLYASDTTDTSFMKLNTPPPAGAMYAGWIVTPVPAVNTATTAVHHPGGDQQKISFANLAFYATCSPPVNGSFSCSTTSSPTSQTFYGVQFTQGITEPGSSGSGLFLNNGHYLIGQLYGGSSSCTNLGTDFYGRLDVAYNAALSQWLGATAPTNYTLTVSKSGTGTGTVTSSPAGINCGSTCSASYANGTVTTVTATADAGSVFAGWSSVACNTAGASCSFIMNGATSVNAVFNSTANMPGAPQNLAAIAGNTQATFTFTPPSNNGGSAIVRYTVSCSPGNFSASATGSPIAITGLANNTTYSCSATATNAVTTGFASAAVNVTPNSSAPLSLIGVASRKTHGTSVFNLPIDASKPITGAVTVEPRSSATQPPLIVFLFNNPVTTAGVVSVVDAAGNPTGSASVSSTGGEVRVQVSGIPDAKRIKVSLAGVNGVLNLSASIGFLEGDVTGTNAAVTASDILMSRGRSGQAANTTNYAFDVDLSGTIDNNDLAETKLRAGVSIP